MRLLGLTVCVSTVACGGGPGDGFVTSVGPGVTPASTTGTGAVGSTSEAAGSVSGAASSTSGGTSSTSGEFSSTAAGGSTDAIYDVGADGDIGPLQPPGCKDKIDFLFVMQHSPKLPEEQQKLAEAFPAFIDTIQERFAGFDVHIMVVDSHADWGEYYCEPMGCLVTDGDGCQVGDVVIPDYPCGVRDALKSNPCYFTMGAGAIYNAGLYASNTPCKVDGGRRYLTQDQSNLKKTFACMAQVGVSGSARNGEAIVAAVGPDLNAEGGCNAGFLRDDALLMITTVTTGDDALSEGTAKEWADAVLMAKKGNASSVIALGIGLWGTDPYRNPSRNGRFIMQFPFHKFGLLSAPSYGEHFAAAVELVDEACKGFTPPG